MIYDLIRLDDPETAQILTVVYLYIHSTGLKVYFFYCANLAVSFPENWLIFFSCAFLKWLNKQGHLICETIETLKFSSSDRINPISIEALNDKADANWLGDL